MDKPITAKEILESRARFWRETMQVIDSTPLDRWMHSIWEQLHAKFRAEQVAWWAGLTRWQRIKWRWRAGWIEVRYRLWRAWDALCGREGE